VLFLVFLLVVRAPSRVVWLSFSHSIPFLSPWFFIAFDFFYSRRAMYSVFDRQPTNKFRALLYTTGAIKLS